MDETKKELAKRLCCAVGSYMMRVSYDHYRRTYFNEDEVTMSPYWFALAETVLREASPAVLGTTTGGGPPDASNDEKSEPNNNGR